MVASLADNRRSKQSQALKAALPQEQAASQVPRKRKLQQDDAPSSTDGLHPQTAKQHKSSKGSSTQGAAAHSRDRSKPGDLSTGEAAASWQSRQASGPAAAASERCAEQIGDGLFNGASAAGQLPHQDKKSNKNEAALQSARIDGKARAKQTKSVAAKPIIPVEQPAATSAEAPAVNAEVATAATKEKKKKKKKKNKDQVQHSVDGTSGDNSVQKQCDVTPACDANQAEDVEQQLRVAKQKHSKKHSQRSPGVSRGADTSPSASTAVAGPSLQERALGTGSGKSSSKLLDKMKARLQGGHFRQVIISLVIWRRTFVAFSIAIVGTSTMSLGWTREIAVDYRCLPSAGTYRSTDIQPELTGSLCSSTTLMCCAAAAEK